MMFPDKVFDVAEQSEIFAREGIIGIKVEQKTGVEPQDLADAPQLHQIWLLYIAFYFGVVRLIHGDHLRDVLLRQIHIFPCVPYLVTESQFYPPYSAEV